MLMDNVRELFLEDETFEEPRRNFNRVLQRLFKTMNDSGSTEGSITLKIDISMEEEYIPNNDPDIEGESRKIQKPSFKHKVSSQVSVKDELGGKKNPEMELVWDDEKQMYVLAYISNTSQRSIFDKDASWNQEQQDSLETDPDKKWVNIPQLPGEVQNPEDNVIDGVYQEVGEAENKAGDDAVRENTGEELGTPPDGDSEGQDDGYSYEEPEETED